ncbi:MAG: hypothetical protein EA387_03710 [Nitriliruptor sp.]|nr:MAG: hypothetical protein EA387_03710 [Nitriliruptor sp.]
MILLIAVLLILNTSMGLLKRPDGPPIFLSVLLVVLPLIATMVPGLVVGAAAELQRWWLVLAAVLSTLGAFASGAVALAFGRLPIFWAPPGVVIGSVLAVVLADRLGRRASRTDASRGAGRA